MLTKNDLQQIRQVVQEEAVPLKNELSEVKTELKKMKSGIFRLQKDVSVIITSTNREDMRLHKRFKRLEDHVGLSTS